METSTRASKKEVKTHADLFLRSQGHIPESIRSAWFNSQWLVLSEPRIRCVRHEYRDTDSWSLLYDNAPLSWDFCEIVFKQKLSLCVGSLDVFT